MTGLRQGDPLSFFILGAEVFVRMIKTDQLKGDLGGVKSEMDGRWYLSLLM